MSDLAKKVVDYLQNNQVGMAQVVESKDCKVMAFEKDLYITETKKTCVVVLSNEAFESDVGVFNTVLKFLQSNPLKS